MIVSIFVCICTALCVAHAVHPPFFVINLASRPERLSVFSNAFGHPFTRINAVDSNKAREFIESGSVHLNDSFRDPSQGRTMKLGEVGCALSHIAAWRLISTLDVDEPKFTYGVVLEDDARLGRPVSDIDAIVSSAEHHRFEFVYLAYRNEPDSVRRPIDGVLHTCAWNYWGLAYMLSPSGARKLLANVDEYLQNLIPVDEYLPIVLGTLDTTSSAASVPQCASNGSCALGSGATILDTRYQSTRLSCAAVVDQFAQPAWNSSYASDTEVSPLVNQVVLPHRAHNTDTDIVIVTVATDISHFGYQNLKRSCDFFGYKLHTLGSGSAWTGGDMAHSTGGGMKLVLMKAFLETLADDQIVVFSDGYDTLFQLSPRTLLNRFDQQQNEKVADVLFAGETHCWPDQTLCDLYISYGNGEYNENSYPFLNSGNYVGRVAALRTLFAFFDESAPGASILDDQRFFSQLLLTSCMGFLNVTVGVDVNGELFQTLNGAPSWSLVNGHGATSVVKNSQGNIPVVIHGNGPSKRTLVGLGNYLAGAYNQFYGTMRHVRADASIARARLTEQDVVIALFFVDTPFEEEFFRRFQRLDHAHENTILFMYYGRQTRYRIEESALQDYLDVRVIDEEDECSARAFVINEVLKARPNTNHILFVESSVMLENSAALADLASWNLPYVAGHAQRERSLWSNYWPGMTNDGWYEDSFDFKELYTRARTGLWQVAHANALVMMSTAHASSYAELFELHVGAGRDCSRRVSISAIDKGLPIFVDNTKVFATLLNDHSYFAPGALHRNLFEASVNPTLWQDMYLVENRQDIALSEPCPDVFSVKLFSDRFCNELLEVVEHENKWSSGEHEDKRVGGYENVPTQDIHTNQFGWESCWLSILRDTISPVILKAFVGMTFQSKIKLAFVVRYSMDGQRELVPHTDASVVTTTVLLNSDFTGGGVTFTRYNCSLVTQEKGTVLMHPGRVTHCHTARAIESGTRYVLVSFNE